MLKLTNSFYRYFKVRYERLCCEAHVRKLSNLSCKKEKCGLDGVQLDATRQIHFTHSLQKHSGGKTLHIKLPALNDIELDSSTPMSELPQPTGNTVSFDVSTDESISSGNWQRNDSSCSKEKPSSQIPPDFRVWEPVGRQSNSGNGNSFRFKVVSYNVLAQYLLECHPYLYSDCSPRNLKWNVRAPRLYDEILHLDPDIVCLQEVQASHLETFYSRFEELGYTGVFKQKTGHRQDGCAIYFKQSRFHLLEYISVEYRQPDMAILNRDNIGVMVKLAPTGVGSEGAGAVVVATTHLLYNPRRTDVRLAQTQVLLAEIDRFAYRTPQTQSGHLPIILTGDLNSLPRSAVIKLLDTGQVNASNYRDDSDWERIGVTDNCQHLSVFLNRQQGHCTDFSTIKLFNSDYCASTSVSRGPPAHSGQFRGHFNGERIGHGLRLKSVYDKYKADGSGEATTFQDEWLTVDYIYYSNVRLTSRLRLPTAAECAPLRRLPNDVYASDHLVLAAAFELTAPAVRPLRAL